MSESQPKTKRKGGQSSRAKRAPVVEAPQRENILVIKLGALGDFMLATGPAKAIRQHHPDANIILLTTRAYRDLGRACPFFDEVWVDSRPKILTDPLGVWRLRQRLRAANFVRVYDLQTSDRSSFYHLLMGPGRHPEWSGIARGCSHPHRNPQRDFMHTLERQADQLKDAGIAEVPAPDIEWLHGNIAGMGLGTEDFALLVPGGSPHRREKYWPMTSYAGLAKRILASGLTPVLIGGAPERSLAADIVRLVPGCCNLIGHTGFGTIAALGRKARYAVGNDTGPTHLIALSGCRTIVLFSGASDPVLTQPRGPDVTVLRRERLADLSIDEVAAALELG